MSTIPDSSANALKASTSSWLYVPNCTPLADCLPDRYTIDNPEYGYQKSATYHKNGQITSSFFEQN